MKKSFPKFSYLFATICFMAFAQFGMAQSTLSVTYATGGFNAENSWTLYDVTAGTEPICGGNNPTAGTMTAPLVEGNTYELHGFETFGDGWCPPANVTFDLVLASGAAITLYDGNTGASGNGSWTCGSGVPMGTVAFSGAIATPNCQIEEPADVTVGTLPGTCDGGQVDLALPTANADCVGIGCDFMTVNSGQNDLVMNPNLALTAFTVAGVPTTAAADVTLVGVWNSDNSFNTENPEFSVEGIVIGNLTFGGPDCAENEFSYTLSMADYNTVAADGMMDFEVAADNDVNGFCASNYITFDINVPTAVCVALNDYNGTEDASDVYPLGTTVVIWTSLDATGIEVTDTTLVTIQDLEGPEFANCPSDMTITLDPGDCNYTLNFDTIATDNCPPNSTLFNSAYCDPCVDPTGGSALACTAGPNSIINEVVLGAGSVIGFNFNQESFGSAPLITVNVYANDGVNVSHDDGAGTYPVLSTGTLQLEAANDGACVFVTMDSTEIDAGSYWVEVVAPGGRAVQTPATCGGNTSAGDISYIYAPACALTEPVLFNSIGFALDAGYSVEMLGAGVEVENTSEAGNGDVLPIGITPIEYIATDGSGNTSVCSFNVTVEEYPEELQTSTLACNGGLNFSVDETCAAIITADMVLEGGPYGCYEDFVVTIAGIPAGALSGNGTNAVTIDASLIAQFVANGMYGPFEITVSDPDAANNSCWNGDFMLEDKLAPVFECDNDVTIACTTSTDPSLNGNPSGTIAAATTDLFAWEGGDTGVVGSASATVGEVPAGAVITDFSIDLDLSHTWVSDLTITLQAPQGDFVLVDGNCGANDDILATFTDAGVPISCSANAPTINNEVQPIDAFTSIAGSSPTGTYTLVFEDAFNGDFGTLNAFSVNVAWEVVLPSTPAISSSDCSEVTVEYTDVTVDGDCTDEFASVITRTWTAVDAKGNEAVPCVQTISVTRESLSTITLPVNWDGLPGNERTIECSENYMTDADGHPSPAMTGEPGGAGACGTIISYYTDVILPICDQACSYTNNSYKVVRKWTILDWCTGEILEPTQIIKVLDTTAPELADLPDLTISTDIWGCGATIELPAAAATDNCTSEGDISYTFSSTAGTQVGNTFVLSDPAKTMPGAPVTITVTASDCCGNSSTTSFDVTVVDLVPPVVVAETSRTVSLSTDGLAKAFAEDFDDGSHDGCGPIGFSVKRMDNGAPCPSLDKFPPAGNDNAQFNESVHFCCADVANSPIMVQFRVCDDADMNGITGTFGDNCNTAMVEVTVQDKLAPQILCPAPVTISCIDLAGIDLTDTDLLDGLFGTAVAAGTCDVSITQTAVGNENCGAGVIFRNFTATNAAGTSSCQQIITVTAGPDNSLTCDRISFAALNNNLYDWCDVNDNSNDPDDDLPALQVDCTDGLSVPEVVIDINGLCTEAGIAIEVDSFEFAGGACRKYLVHYEVIDQCIFDENYVDPVTSEIDPYNSSNGYFEFFIEIDAFDDEEPVPACDDITVVAESCTGIDATITVTATDNCTDPAFFGYQWRLDVDNNNTIDFPASGWVATSSVTPDQVGLTEFPIGEHRIFWIISDGCGNDATCSQLVTITGNDKEPTPYCYDGLSVAVMPSTGSVALWANDFDAGSFDNCGGDLVLSMIPESDVDGLSDDDAYDQSFNHPNVTQQANGDWGFEFNCDYIENGISAVIEVRMYVTDADGNYDYCTASLRLDDNFDACEDGPGTKYEASGELKTEEGESVINTDVTVMASFPEFPMTENVAGSYSFDLIENVDYTITPERSDDHLNGVTTLDLVLIQKHILGLEILDSPYKLIAADVHDDCNINGLDLVEARRLLLGKYASDEFPNNESWRFVESDYEFTNPSNPCNFSEVADIFNMNNDEVNDFVGVKIGDVNGTAVSNLTMDAETRSNETIEFVVADNALVAGSTYEIDFLAKDFNEVYGFQNTINLTGVEFVGVTAGALNVTENNFGFANVSNGELVLSVDLANGVSLADDAVLFTITVKALNNATTSEVIAMNSNRLEAQAYVGRNIEVLTNGIVFRTDLGDLATANFALFQNEPNPFNGQTTIGFELPTTSEATLTVYDVTGKVLYTKVDGYAAGYNTVTLSRDNVPATGVLYYKLENGNNVATMKMIILE